MKTNNKNNKEKKKVTKPQRSKGYRAAMVILPMVAVALVAVIVFLVMNMPEGVEVTLRPVRETSFEVQSTQHAPAATAEQVSLEESQTKQKGKAPQVIEVKSHKYSRTELNELLQMGMGLPKTARGADIPKLVNKTGDTVPTWSMETTVPTEAPTAAPSETANQETAATEVTEGQNTSATNEVETTVPSVRVVIGENPIPSGTVETTPQELTSESSEVANSETPESSETELAVSSEPAELEESEALSEEIPSEEVPAEEIPSDEIPAEEVPAEEIPAEEGADYSDFYATDVPMYVMGNIVNVRADADMNSEVFTEVTTGDVVHEIERNGSWSRVRLADGFEGYIFSNLLSINYVAPVENEYLVYDPVLPAEGEEDPGMDEAELPPGAEGEVDPGLGEEVPEEPAYDLTGFAPHEQVLYSMHSAVNIRSGPSTDSPIVGTLYYGDSVTTSAYNGGWFEILYNGGVAYVHGENLQEEEISADELTGQVVHQDVEHEVVQPDIPAADLAGGGAVVNLAMQHLGKAYVLGGTGPDAFDCSGLVYSVYQAMGVSLGRTTYDQVYNGVGVPFGYKDYSNLVPGDILLFGEGTNVYHAGLYIGGGQMLHAGTPETGVVIDDLNMDFWASRLAHVRRIFY